MIYLESSLQIPVKWNYYHDAYPVDTTIVTHFIWPNFQIEPDVLRNCFLFYKNVFLVEIF